MDPKEKPRPIIWALAAIDGDYIRDVFATDRANIATALERIGAFDVPAVKAEETVVDKQLVLPVSPDALSERVVDRAQSLCNSGAKYPPILFRAEWSRSALTPSEGATRTFYKLPGEGEDSQWNLLGGIDYEETIHAFNTVAHDERRNVRFRFEVVFGNIHGGLKWSVARWMEVIIHEIGIHVVQCLHRIDLWRNGNDWSDAEGGDSLDHLFFRFAGIRRYSYWCNKVKADEERKEMTEAVREWDAKEVNLSRDKSGRAYFDRFYRATLPQSTTSLKFVDCWQLAAHFPNIEGNAVKHARDSGSVDKARSQAFLTALRTHLDQVFEYQSGVVKGRKRSLFWWPWQSP